MSHDTGLKSECETIIPTRLDPEQLARRLAAQVTSTDDRDALLEDFGRALIAMDVPLWRLSVSVPAIDPTESGFAFNWIVDQGTTFIHTTYSAETEAAFLRSPIHRLIETNEYLGRWRLDTLQPDVDLPLLHELKDAGGIDYVLHLIRFTPGTALHGTGISFTTMDEAGFTDRHLAIIEHVLPTFGLAVSKLGLLQTLRETLATYLGPATGTRVLEGQIRRGEGQTVSAAILLTDLRGFTALTDRSEPLAVVGWLNEHFDALGDPVLRNGGEILKFLGDGFLAIFPVTDPGARPCTVCAKAVDAAASALLANRALNDRRRLAGLPALEADVILHFGEVVYGNVGTSRRLDFTVIGRAVNEASRIEKLCEQLDQSLLISDAFAARCERPLVPVANVSLRGLERLQQVWTLPKQNLRDLG